MEERKEKNVHVFINEFIIKKVKLIDIYLY